MGKILSRFRKSQSTKDVLLKLTNDIKSLDKARNSLQVREKNVSLALVTVALLTFISGLLVVYFYYPPEDVQDSLILTTIFTVYPLIIWILRKMLLWYYRRRHKTKDNKLAKLKEKKEIIIKDVMETETFRVAREILEIYAPEQLWKHQVIIKQTPTKSQDAAARKMIVPVADKNAMELRKRTGASSAPSTPVHPGKPAANDTAAQAMRKLHERNGDLTTKTVHEPTALGLPLPRPVLPRERSAVDRLVDYFVGDGPSNRYALICRQCESHNGMALKEEFEYVAFRCCYCHSWNPSRKQRPAAPRLLTSNESSDQHESNVTSSDSDETSSSEKESGRSTPSDLDIDKEEMLLKEVIKEAEAANKVTADPVVAVNSAHDKQESADSDSEVDDSVESSLNTEETTEVSTSLNDEPAENRTQQCDSSGGELLGGSKIEEMDVDSQPAAEES